MVAHIFQSFQNIFLEQWGSFCECEYLAILSQRERTKAKGRGGSGGLLRANGFGGHVEPASLHRKQREKHTHANANKQEVTFGLFTLYSTNSKYRESDQPTTAYL
jgi:hypothetical protein